MSDTTAPQVLPVTIQPQDFTQMVNYLLDQPARFSAPLLNYFQNAQAEAQKAAQEPGEPETVAAPKPKARRK